jgi:hypothetical protein
MGIKTTNKVEYLKQCVLEMGTCIDEMETVMNVFKERLAWLFKELEEEE